MDSFLPPQLDPVVLTWTQDTSPEENPHIPFGAPPSFSRLSSDSMLLVLPPNLPDTKPLYHISVNIYLFNR
ncbi:hypothetical protein BDZ89DRAFT_1077079, partial [Hymenopellis radicata]